MYETLLKLKYAGKFAAIALVGLITLLMIFSAVWQVIVRRHVAQFDETISPRMAAATQEAFAEKAAYEAAEFRVKRLKKEIPASFLKQGFCPFLSPAASEKKHRKMNFRSVRRDYLPAIARFSRSRSIPRSS